MTDANQGESRVSSRSAQGDMAAPEPSSFQSNTMPRLYTLEFPQNPNSSLGQDAPASNNTLAPQLSQPSGGPAVAPYTHRFRDAILRDVLALYGATDSSDIQQPQYGSAAEASLAGDRYTVRAIVLTEPSPYITSSVNRGSQTASIRRTNEQTGLHGRVHDHTANLTHEHLQFQDSTVVNSPSPGHVGDALGGGDQSVGDTIAHTSGPHDYIHPYLTGEDRRGSSRDLSAQTTGSIQPDTLDVHGTATTPGRTARARRADPNVLRRGAAIRGEAPPEAWKTNDGIRERVLPLKPSGRYFDTYEESVRSNKGPNWTPPSGDIVPKTDKEMLPFVDLLMSAILDLTQYTDNRGMAMKKRFFDIGWEEGQPMGAEITNTYYPKHVFERLAWQTVHRCQQLHLHGPASIPCYDPLLLEESFTASELTFSQRIDAFADIFRRSKNRVKNLLRGDLIDEYMLVPGNVMKNTLQNIKHNQNRQGILEEHREQWMQERNMVVKKRGMKKTPRSAASKDQEQVGTIPVQAHQGTAQRRTKTAFGLRTTTRETTLVTPELSAYEQLTSASRGDDTTYLPHGQNVSLMNEVISVSSGPGDDELESRDITMMPTTGKRGRHEDDEAGSSGPKRSRTN